MDMKIADFDPGSTSEAGREVERDGEGGRRLGMCGGGNRRVLYRSYLGIWSEVRLDREPIRPGRLRSIHEFTNFLVTAWRSSGGSAADCSLGRG